VSWCDVNQTYLRGRKLWVEKASEHDAAKVWPCFFCSTCMYFLNHGPQKAQRYQPHAIDHLLLLPRIVTLWPRRIVKEAPIVDRGQLFWEYRLSIAPDAEIHGPYPTEQMLEWWEAGYFNAPTTEVRSLGDDEGEWTPATEVDFSLFP
jgi:hypothetical protein